MTSAQLEAMLAESGLDPDASADLGDLLSSLAVTAGDPPAPSADLAALFGEDVPRPPRKRSRRRGQGAVAGVLVLTVAGVGATGLSAAANTLPHPWQRGVSHFAHHYLPFDLPAPPAAPGDSAGMPGRTTPLGRTDRPARHPARHRDREAHEPSRSLAPGRQAAPVAPTSSGPRSGHGSRQPSGHPVPAATAHSAQAAPAQASTVTYAVPHPAPAVSQPAVSHPVGSPPGVSQPAISQPAVSTPVLPHLQQPPHPGGPRKHHDHTRGTESPHDGRHDGPHHGETGGQQGSKAGSKAGNKLAPSPRATVAAPRQPQRPHQIPVPDPSKVRGSAPSTGRDEVRDVSDTSPGA